MDNKDFDEFSEDYTKGYIEGTHQGFIMGRGQQAKEVREKLAQFFGTGLQYMKELKVIEDKGENVAKANEEKIKKIWESIKNKV